MSTPPKSAQINPVIAITHSIMTEAAQHPWLAALLMRRPDWLAQLVQCVRNLPRRARRKLVSGLATATLLLTLAGTPTAYAADITVTAGAAGLVTDSQCSLAEASVNANGDATTWSDCAAGNGADTITLPASATLSYAAALNGDSALPDITSQITIEASGSTIQRAGASGNFRILKIAFGGNLILNQVTISGGNPDFSVGGGILNDGTLTVQNSTISGNTAITGGGISNGGTLTVTNSMISNNSANGGHGNGYGGGIRSNGLLAVQNSTISGNTAQGGLFIGPGGSSGYGGGIWSNGLLAVQNSTITGNAAVGVGSSGHAWGGGIFNYSGTLTVQNGTITGNSAHDGGSGLKGSATISNSIVAGNTFSNDCSQSLISNGYNIESATSCGFNQTGDQQNVTTGLKLLVLADNGGPTWTRALDNGSVALEKIPAGTNGCGTTFTTDQRGYARPGTRSDQVAKKCEIGAWEAQTEDPTAVTLRDLTAMVNPSPGMGGALGAALTALGALLLFIRRFGKALRTKELPGGDNNP